MLIIKLILIWIGAFALVTTGLDFLFFALIAGGVLTAMSFELEDVKKKIARQREATQIEPEISADPVSAKFVEIPHTSTDGLQGELAAPASKQEKPPFSYEEFFGKKFFGALGVISIIAALAFFSVWAFEHNLIGPKGRIALGIILSLAFIVAGELLRSRFQKSYLLLTAIGIGGVLVGSFFRRSSS